MYWRRNGVSWFDCKKKSVCALSLLSLWVVQLMECEERIAALEEEIRNLSSGNISRKVGKGDALPTPPARMTLAGHRLPVTGVAYHPRSAKNT